MNKHDGDREMELGRFGEYLLKSRAVGETHHRVQTRSIMGGVRSRVFLGTFESSGVLFTQTGVQSNDRFPEHLLLVE